MSNKILILANPFSGRNNNQALMNELSGRLKAEGLIPDIRWHMYDWPTAESIAESGEIYRCVVSAGGDGTLGDVINLKLDIPVVMYPLGNENLFAKPFGYSKDPANIVDIIDRDEVHKISLGQVNDRLFTLMCSAGYDAAVVHHISEWREVDAPNLLKRVHRSSYALPMLRTGTQYKFPDINIRINGESSHGKMIVVFNIRRYGLDLDFIPDHVLENPDAPLLSYIIFEKGGWRNVMKDILQIRSGKHLKRKDIRIGQAEEIHLSYTDAFNPTPMQADGDPVGFTPATIKIIPDALELLK